MNEQDKLVNTITYGVLLAAFAEFGITPEAFRRAAAAVARTNAFAPAPERVPPWHGIEHTAEVDEAIAGARADWYAALAGGAAWEQAVITRERRKEVIPPAPPGVRDRFGRWGREYDEEGTQ
jgi:hypothetical protein